MAIPRSIVKRGARLALLLVFMLACAPQQAAGAQGTYQDGLIPAGATLQGSQFLFAPRINIEGTVDGDVFAIGQQVSLTGEIKGSLFVLSNTAEIEGTLEGDLYTANTRLTLGPAPNIGRSAYVLAGIVNMLPDSQIGRDLYLIGLSGEISGTVGRYQRIHLGIVSLLELLLGENGMLRPLLPPGFRLPWTSIDNFAARNYTASHLVARPWQSAAILTSGVSGLKLSGMGLPMLLQPQAQIPPIDSAALVSWFLARLRIFAPLFLIGLLLLWLFPRFLQGSTGNLRAHPLTSFGIGVVILFVGLGVAVLSLALVAALGLFFAAINYWNLALMIWGAGLGALSLALAVFGLALNYLSKIVVAYLFGALLLGWLPGAFWGRRLWMLLLGLLLVVLLLAIPFLGWVLSVLITLFGLGAIYLQLRQRTQKGEEPAQELTGAPAAEASMEQPQLVVEAPAAASPELEPEMAQAEEQAAELISEGASQEIRDQAIEYPSSLEERIEAAPEENSEASADLGSDAPAVADNKEEVIPD